MVGSLKTPMVLLEAALSPRERKPPPSPPRKRKWVERESGQDDEEEEEKEHLSKEMKLWSDDSIDLHLDSPLPPEWQRCLDIQSGKIHFYNTRTQRRTWKDPRRRAAGEPPPAAAELNLELNLTCESSPSVCHGGEMVAAVCGRCFMLVMMSRSSPSCPNCKFSPRPEEGALPKPAARAVVL